MVKVLFGIVLIWALMAGAPSNAETGLGRPLGEQLVLAIGDSLTAGFGLEQEQAYPAVLQRLAAKEGLAVRVINGGMSGDTSAGALRRLDWILRNPPDVVLVAVGANDGLRGLRPEDLRRNLLSIIDKIRVVNQAATVIIAGLEMPPNMGDEYRDTFRAVFPDVARQRGIPLIPFLLEGVAGEPSLNQPDRMHPNAEGQERIARHVWMTLEPILQSRFKKLGS
jgi:acyl-CoA thioesterase-1